MVIIKLKEVILAHQRRTGARVTYDDLAGMTGLAVGTLQSIATRANYHPTLANIEKICLALQIPVQDLLEIVPDPPKAKKKAKRR